MKRKLEDALGECVKAEGEEGRKAIIALGRVNRHRTAEVRKGEGGGEEGGCLFGPMMEIYLSTIFL